MVIAVCILAYKGSLYIVYTHITRYFRRILANEYFRVISKITESNKGLLFKDIIGYNEVKRLLRMALDSNEQSDILLSGPPASAKTMFLESLRNLKSPYFVLYFCTNLSHIMLHTTC